MGLQTLCSGVRLGLTSMAGHSAVAAESALATVYGGHCFAVMYGRQCLGAALNEVWCRVPQKLFSSSNRARKAAYVPKLREDAGCVPRAVMLEAAPMHVYGTSGARGGVIDVECRRAQKERA